MPTTSLQSVTDDGFTAEVLEVDGPVLVDFTADWCPPCRIMNPVLEELAAEQPGLKVVQLDVDAHQATAARYSVLSMPTFMVFRDGAPVRTIIGARPKRRLLAELADLV